ncbi:MAG TPA: DUF3782 domain-containing protein, partial [Candidatus Korarchaeota archaeon]|nr:DUF3782 domain-containing protein [Candidatus Korarchaeota archaeon]
VSRLVEVTEEHSRRLDELSRSVSRLVEVTEEHSRSIFELGARLEVTIGSMGRRWGIDLERTVLSIFREILEQRGIEPGKVEKFRFKDVEGKYLRKGTIVDVDVLVRDEKLYVIEVKSRAERDHVEMLPEKASVVEKVLGRAVDEILLVAVNIDDDALERAKELRIGTIYGNVISA